MCNGSPQPDANGSPCLCREAKCGTCDHWLGATALGYGNCYDPSHMGPSQRHEGDTGCRHWTPRRVARWH